MVWMPVQIMDITLFFQKLTIRGPLEIIRAKLLT